LLTAFYVTEGRGERVRLPIGFKVIAKTETYTDEKSGEEKQKSPRTKNRMMREMIGRHIRNQVKCRYILGNSWFASVKNMKYINKDEVIKLFSPGVLETTFDLAVCAAMFLSGLRMAEIFALKPECLDWHTPKIKVKNTWQCYNKKKRRDWVPQKTNGTGTRRLIPFYRKR
jgi:integrase